MRYNSSDCMKPPCSCIRDTIYPPMPPMPQHAGMYCPVMDIGCIENYPAAMCYVPWQKWKQPYSLDKGLKAGTIFEDLDLPFKKGRC